MDRIRTLLLARTHLVVLDPDLAASAATRPSRSQDVDKFEAELVALGFVMSLDLAITIRRLPHEAIAELRAWMTNVLAAEVGAQRPQVPLFKQLAPSTAEDAWTLYTQRVVSWLATSPDQPCPWCSGSKHVGAIDPCGHLVCRTCWEGGSYAGCPICHRRVVLNDPFIPWERAAPSGERVRAETPTLRLLHLGFDVAGSARARFERLLSRASPLSADDRREIEAVIDELGPKAAAWLPARVAVKETLAIAIARLWMVAPDRAAIVEATAGHLRTAADVLRVAVVLMGGDPRLRAGEPCKLVSIARALRLAVLAALDRLPVDAVAEDMRRHAALWKRVGERLHPFEHAKRLPSAALAFAVLRGTRVDAASFGAALRAKAEGHATLRLEDDRLRVIPWLGAVEAGLQSGDARAVAEKLAQRPAELLRRADHVVRVAQAKQPDALKPVLASIRGATARGAPGRLLTLAAHISRRDRAWPRRVMFPHSEALRAWTTSDERAPLRADAITSIVTAARSELLARAAAHRNFPRAVIDRDLGELLLPIGRAGLWRHARAILTLGTRPTLWDLACIHAAGRANIVYVRERDGAITTYRRRDGEAAEARLARLLAGTPADGDGTLAAIPQANAPTWFALLRDDLTIPTGSAGYVLDARCGGTWLAAGDLLAELRPR